MNDQKPGFVLVCQGILCGRRGANLVVHYGGRVCLIVYLWRIGRATGNVFVLNILQGCEGVDTQGYTSGDDQGEEYAGVG